MLPVRGPNLTAVAVTTTASATSSVATVAAASAVGLTSMSTTSEIPPEEIFHNCYESEGFIKFQYTVDDLLLAASTASTVFNFLVIFCAFKLLKNGDTMHLFIINMTLGDLLLTVFCHPNEFLMRKHAFLRHIHLCAVIHFCNWLGLAVSGLSLTLLNVDKLIYFRWPLSYDQTMSKRRAAILCFFIWGVSFGFVSYVWIFNIVYATSDCMLQMTDEKKYFYEIFMIMFCVLPVTSSLFVSTYLFRLTRQKRHAPVPVAGAQVDIRTFRNKVRSLVFIFATTAWTSFSLLPYRIFNICRIHLFEWNSIACEQRVIMNWLAWMLIYLLTLNPIVNPLITTTIYAPYRMTLKKLLINIPIGNRLQYTYRTGDTTETSAENTTTSTRHHSFGGGGSGHRRRQSSTTCGSSTRRAAGYYGESPPPSYAKAQSSSLYRYSGGRAVTAGAELLFTVGADDDAGWRYIDEKSPTSVSGAAMPPLCRLVSSSSEPQLLVGGEDE